MTWLLNSVVKGQYQGIDLEKAASDRGLFYFWLAAALWSLRRRVRTPHKLAKTANPPPKLPGMRPHFLAKLRLAA
ncbi:MAG TPA: hypothetical protein VFJ52_10020 [Terriglobia bacterium]|nr:hypothetical protein [Terriglobia bacterium]